MWSSHVRWKCSHAICADRQLQLEEDELTLLSEREKQVFRLIGEGLRTRAVAGNCA